MTIVIIINSVFFLIFLIFSGYWGFIFARRIYCYRKYKRGVARYLSGDSGYLNKQYYYHYETEIWKNTILLLIAFSEIIACIFFFTLETIHHYLTYHYVSNNTLELPFTDCISHNKPPLNQINILYTEIPFLNGLCTIARSAELFVFAFCIYLKNYLIIRIKKIKQPYNTLNYRQLIIITTLLSTVIILTGFIQYTTVISTVLFLVSVITYFCIFVHTSKRFKYALLQRALERLTQHGSNKEEMKQCRYCKNTINIMTWGYLFMILAELLFDIRGIFTRMLIFGDCNFPFNFFNSLKYVIQTEQGIDTFITVMQYTEFVGRVISFLSISILLSPFLFVTICIWSKHIHKYIRGTKKIKYSTVNKDLEALLNSH